MNSEKPQGLFSKSWTFSQSKKVKEIIRSFSIAEKVLFYGLIAVFTLSAGTMLYQVNAHFLVTEPAHGGTLIEGVVGSPRFVNPLLALSDVDKNLTTLVYSGLVKLDASGNLIPDIASAYTVSADALTYTFVLRSDAVFSDGTKVTADDVVFTITKAEDVNLKSPRGNTWAGVKAQKVDDQTVTITLPQPYTPFIYNVTLGILPKHIWQNVTDESFPFSTFNSKAVGSGLYRVEKVVTDSSGLPTEYDLVANKTYALGEPYITHIVMKFYQTENDAINAYNKSDVDSISGVSPENTVLVKRTDNVLLSGTLSRVFAVFWNQNNAPVLVHKEVRIALDHALDKQLMIDTVLRGYGHPLSGPLATDRAIPPQQKNIATSTTDQYIAEARTLLEKAGWKIGTDGIYAKQDPKDKKKIERLAFALSTSDAPELKAIAEMIQTTWQKVGAQVQVKVFEIGDLNQNIIRPRKYDALLFGEIIAPGLDLYPFWHSSQRNDPGLNIAEYANIKADKILETMRKTTDQVKVAALEKDFEKEVSADSPASFLYAPDFIYIVPNSLYIPPLQQLGSASERFADVGNWYIETNKVWSIFSNK